MPIKSKRYTAQTCFLAISIVAITAYAQPGPVPDWTGYYMLARGKDAAGLNIVSLDLSKTVAAHLQPWARLRMQETNGVADDTGAVCQPSGILRGSGMPFSSDFLFLPHGDKVVMPYFQNATARIRWIHLNREHPRNVLPTWNGHSIGRWEGDTLLVDTIGFNDQSWLSAEMAPHTEETHLTERMRQVQHDGSTYIEVVGTVEDRHALTSAYTYSRFYKKQTREMPIAICNDDIQMWKEWRRNVLKQEEERAREVR